MFGGCFLGWPQASTPVFCKVGVGLGDPQPSLCCESGFGGGSAVPQPLAAAPLLLVASNELPTAEAPL